MEPDEEELCQYCPLTAYGTVKVNTGPHDLCEGTYCHIARENYKEEKEAGSL